MSGPLAGVRILEVGHILAGPFAAMLLADLGADVIKIESDTGDLSREVGSQSVGGHNVYFASLNRNKRSVHINLATDDGQADLHQLVRTADALIVNLRPSAIRKLGVDYASLREVNPRIVCVSLTGYGLDGPEAEWPAFDYVIQAGTGLAAMTGDPAGPPMLPGYSAVDNSAAIMAALALVAKVHEGRGGQVDVSLFDSMLAQLNYKAAAYLNGGQIPSRHRDGAHSFYVPAQLFETAEGWLALFVTHDEFWRKLCDEIDEPAWGRDPRFATMHARNDNRAELIELVGARLRQDTAARWVAKLRPLGLAVGAVVGLDETLGSERIRQRDMIVSVPTDDGPLYLLGSPIRFDEPAQFRPPPRLHEHTAELLGSSDGTTSGEVHHEDRGREDPEPQVGEAP